MIYLDGDNNLEEYLLNEINEFENVDIAKKDVKVDAKFDASVGAKSGCK